MQEPSKNGSGDKIYVSENYVTWTSYEYETINVITRRSDGAVISEQEYEIERSKKTFRKSHYKIQAETRVTKIEKTNKDG